MKVNIYQIYVMNTIIWAILNLNYNSDCTTPCMENKSSALLFSPFIDFPTLQTKIKREHGKILKSAQVGKGDKFLLKNKNSSCGLLDCDAM
jgi:hypothetical protein